MKSKSLAFGIITLFTLLLFQLSQSSSKTGFFTAGIETPTNVFVDYSQDYLKVFYTTSNGKFLQNADCTLKLNGETHAMQERIGYYAYPLPNRAYEVTVTCSKKGYATAQKTKPTM
ncbi:MAG: hypothetical protein GOU97_04980 [Nanoarchaeota archaeon]|nr:hypothetical protein [Nanoarchaeota archaeon]